MTNSDLYSNLQNIIKDHEKKEMALKIVKTCLEMMKEGEEFDVESLLKTVNEALK